MTAQNTPIKANITIQDDCATQITDVDLLQIPQFHDDTETVTTNDDQVNNWISVNTFDQFHTIMSDIVSTWITTTTNKSHPFYISWMKATYLGLNRTAPWDRLCSKLSIHNIVEYITIIQQCRLVQDHYLIDYDLTTGILRYCNTKLPVIDQINSDILNFNKLHQRISDMSYSFTTKLNQLNDSISVTMAQTTMCQKKSQHKLNMEVTKSRHIALSNLNILWNKYHTKRTKLKIISNSTWTHLL